MSAGCGSPVMDISWYFTKKVKSNGEWRKSSSNSSRLWNVVDDVWWLLMIFDVVWWFLMMFDDFWVCPCLSLPKCAVPSHSKHSALRRNASLAQTTWRWAYKEVEAHCPHNLGEIRDISGTRLLVNTRRNRVIFRRLFSCSGLYLIFWTLRFEPA